MNNAISQSIRENQLLKCLSKYSIMVDDSCFMMETGVDSDTINNLADEVMTGENENDQEEINAVLHQVVLTISADDEFIGTLSLKQILDAKLDQSENCFFVDHERSDSMKIAFKKLVDVEL